MASLTAANLTTALPSRLEAKFTALEKRIRSRRLWRGLSWVVLVQLLVAAGLVALDAAIAIPLGGRVGCLAGWVALGIGLVWIKVVHPLSQAIPREDLAVLVEDEYPILAERLSTTISLQQHAGAGNGSPRLIRMLARETEQRTRRIHFDATVPWTGTIGLGAIALALFLGTLTGVTVLPHSKEHVRRFLLPWYTPPVEVPYRLVVTSGSPTVKRGENMTLSGYLEATAAEAELPGTVEVRLRSLDGQIETLPMVSKGEQVYALQRTQVVSTFDYRLEAGPLASAWQRVQVVDPVELTGETHTLIEMPAYARRPEQAEQRIDGLQDLEVWQYGKVTFQLQFNQPPERAYFAWRPVVGAEEGIGEVLRKYWPIQLKGSLGSQTHVPTETGTLTLHMESRSGVSSEVSPFRLKVRIDQPPRFTRVQGVTEEPREVRPQEVVPIAFAADDDLGITAVEVEYRINDGPIQTEAIVLQRPTLVEATGSHGLALKDRVQQGDRLFFRLKARDIRDLPEHGLTPQEVYFPSDGHWSELRIDRDAASLKEQEIAAQQAQLRKQLQALIQSVQREQRGVYKLRMETRDHPVLDNEHKDDLKDLQEVHQGNQDQLQRMIRDLEATPELGTLLEPLRAVQQEPMKAAAKHLDQANRATQFGQRNDQLEQADQHLEAALKRLEQLRQASEELAQQRRDRNTLERLQQQQQSLAEQAAQAKSPEALRRLQAAQQEIARQLEELTQKSPRLRAAAEAKQNAQALKLADRAQQLAEDQRSLAQSIDKTEQAQRAEQLAELGKQQEQLNQQIEQLAQQTQSATRAAQTRPLDQESSRQAQQALKQSDIYEAMKEQSNAARELERLAAALERAAAQADDPREMARQLARLQEDLRKRLADATRRQALAELPEEKRQSLAGEQRALQAALEQLPVPHDDAAVREAHQEVVRQAERTREALDNQATETRQADEQMGATRDALKQLAMKLPTKAELDRRARAAVNAMKTRQDQLAAAVREQAQSLAKQDPNAAATRAALADKLQEAVREQAEVATKLAKLEVPRAHRDRWQRTQQAVMQALSDLLNAHPQDVTATQERAARELGRLQQALHQKTPADEQARKLMREQQALTDDAKRVAENPSPGQAERNPLITRQQQLREQLEQLDAPEAPNRLATAQEALQQAEQAARDPDPTVLAQASQAAAQQLEQLAAQMQGQETNAARAERLARKQADAATEAERLAKKPPEPNAQLAARKRAQQLQRETEQLQGGAQGQREKQKALEALRRLERSPPQERVAAESEAAQALRRLADKLAQRDTPAAQAAEIARQQRQLADQASQANRNQGPAMANRQADLARRTEQLAQETPNPPEAARQALEPMQQAREQLEQGPPPAAEEALKQAAKAAEQLARALGPQSPAPPEAKQPTSERLAERLAEAQRELAEQTKQAADQAGEARQQALQQAARQQAELNRQAEQLRSPEQARAIAQARSAMNQAERALTEQDATRAQQQQQQATQALEQLAQQARANPSGTPPAADSAGQLNLPTKDQAEQARELARQQRLLREQSLRALDQLNRQARDQSASGQNPVGDLAQRQEQLAEDAEELARSSTQQQGAQAASSQQARQAAQAARQANQQLQRGELKAAQELGRMVTQRLQQLAQAQPDTDMGRRARQLAERQESLQRGLQPHLDNRQAARAQQTMRQQQLQDEAARLGERFDQLAQGENRPQARAAEQAARAASRAQQAMSQASAAAQGNRPEDSARSRQQAAKSLEEAARLAQQAAGQDPGNPPDANTRELGQSLENAQQGMAQAKQQLNQGQSDSAGKAMQQAGQALSRAAQQMMANRSPSQPSGTPREGGAPGNNTGTDPAPVDLSLLGKDAKKYSGKAWGELPGELQTQIIQDMRARYGEDYARAIRYYFEQTAEQK